MTYTPGRAAHDSLRDSAPSAFGRPAGDFATWDQLPPEKQERMADAGRKEIAAYIEANGGDPAALALIAKAEETPGYWYVRAALAVAEGALQYVKLGTDDGLAALAREALAKVDELTEEGGFLADAASLDTDLGDSRDVLDRALTIAAHEAAFETDADAGGERERWLREARLQEAMFGAQSSAKGQRPEDQPLPKPGTGPSMHDLAIADLTASGWLGSTAAAELLAARKRIGIDRYGSILQAGNGRDAQRDLAEEIADGVVYARQAIEEGRLPGWRGHVIGDAYKTLLRLLSEVCWLRSCVLTEVTR